MLSAAKKKHFTVIALFAVVAAVTLFYKIERRTQPSPINLNAIPQTIGEWEMTVQNNTIGQYESTFLDSVLARNYQRANNGKVITLIIAHGSDQRKPFSLHFPEDCYKAAGYVVTSYGYELMTRPQLELKKLVARNVTVEPMHYWIVLDGQIITSQFEMSLKRLYYGLGSGKTAGVLVRLSSVAAEQNFQKDFEMQKDFIRTLYNSLTPELRKHLFGSNNDK